MFNEAETSPAVFEVSLHDFHFAASGPRWLAALNTRCFPMSAFVVVDKQLNRSFMSPKDDSIVNESFCYSFLNKKSGPWFLGFGPGKFERAVKHYSFSLMADGSLEVQLAFLVNPRSQRVLDLAGVDPVYDSTKLLDWVTGRRFKLFSTVQWKMEMMMMKQHVRVHEQMLATLFQRLEFAY